MCCCVGSSHSVILYLESHFDSVRSSFRSKGKTDVFSDTNWEGAEPLTRFLQYIQFMLVGFVSQTLHFLVLALGSSACAIAQSPVSATDQQRHQVSTGQVAQAAAVQDGAS